MRAWPLTRAARRGVGALAALGAFASPAAAAPQGAPPQAPLNAPAPDDPLTLWYRQPAKAWTEALPVGNGHLGAMDFGGVQTERLQLNEMTLWEGNPGDRNARSAAT